MRTSEQGKAFNRRFEGCVLRAYRCPAGKWTIGDGLTAASGVVDPGPGMEITQEQADRLLDEALRRNYEPAVNRAMPGAKQHEFDGGVSFHWNTGKIGSASWVPAWAAGNMAQMRERLARWNKGGGKVLPGLVRRRAAEADLIEHGDYGVPPSARSPRGAAPMALDLNRAEIAAVRDGLKAIGYEPGDDPRGVTVQAVRRFQADHDLTVDGVLGRATLSTLERRLNARTNTATAAATTVVGGAEVTTDALPADGIYDWVGEIALGLGLIFLAYTAWQYRDVIAAKLNETAPRLAAWLRSIK